MTRTLTAVLHKEGKLFVAECPEVGTISQEPNLEEAACNLQEATGLYLEEFPVKERTSGWRLKVRRVSGGGAGSSGA